MGAGTRARGSESAGRTTGLVRKLRPAKVRSAVRRRWFEYQLSNIAVTEAGSPTHLGTAYGGWMAPATVIHPGWLCYSVGVGGDVSFDAELIDRFGMRVRAFEPVQHFVDFAAKTMRGEPRFSVTRVAIASHDGPVLMQHTHHPGSRAVSAAGLFDTRDEWDQFPGRSLPSLMAEYGDKQIDLLKMDTEGTEYDLLPSLDLRALGIKVLAVCLHHNKSVRRARRLIASLISQDYEPVALCPAAKITFAHRSALPPGAPAGSAGTITVTDRRLASGATAASRQRGGHGGREGASR
jgi:FkbM family methyltransferase